MSSAAATVERTPLYDQHVALHAQMTNFGGWSMPLQYTSIREEHRAVRTAAGIFDLSHMGEIRVRGGGALSLVQRVVARDVARLKPGRAQYTVLCNQGGGIIDDLLVYAEDDGYLLVVNAGNQDQDFEWIRSHAGRDSEVSNIGRETALIGVQGPRAVEIVERLAGQDLKAVRYYAFIDGTVAGVRARLSRTGYTGEDGFEIFSAPGDAVKVWKALLDAGLKDGLKPAGLGARDTLRLEAGMRLYGNDMDVNTNPFQAGLDWTVSLGKEFIGVEALRRVAGNPDRVIAGLRMMDRSIPRHGYAVVDDGRQIGSVGSGNVSFTLGYNIAMVAVPPGRAAIGTRLGVDVRGTVAPAEVVPLPFYKRPQS
ncbi:MAG TPA: glycine cleavage system aminomethyltransferase GcvT [Candidatus Dormibacteraeota bacterium]|nr:glycine cleavage system aminomethyltransferase GcvT [Candidatus Dormibacteraeota bacterium]